MFLCPECRKRLGWRKDISFDNYIIPVDPRRERNIYIHVGSHIRWFLESRCGFEAEVFEKARGI